MIKQWNPDLFFCKKQTTLAIIIKDAQILSIASNYILNNIATCPRKGMSTGEGYDLCKNICAQVGHAEENACKLAGVNSKDATLYLIGHTYICNNCFRIIKMYGIKNAIICDTGEILNVS